MPAAAHRRPLPTIHNPLQRRNNIFRALAKYEELRFLRWGKRPAQVVPFFQHVVPRVRFADRGNHGCVSFCHARRASPLLSGSSAGFPGVSRGFRRFRGFRGFPGVSGTVTTITKFYPSCQRTHTTANSPRATPTRPIPPRPISLQFASLGRKRVPHFRYEAIADDARAEFGSSIAVAVYGRLRGRHG